MQTERKLTNLQVWQKAMKFAVLICKEIVPNLPKEEQFVLADQLRRAAQSIPANIAEGFGRHHYQDAVRFNYIARGSVVEVFSHLTFANRMGYIADEKYADLVNYLQYLHKSLNVYITFLKQAKKGSPETNHTIHEAITGYQWEGSDGNCF